MCRAGAILKARLKLRVLTFFWRSASFRVELKAAHSFLAKVGTLSVRSQPVGGVDLQKKKVTTIFLSVRSAGFAANDKKKVVTFSFPFLEIHSTVRARSKAERPNFGQKAVLGNKPNK